MSGEELTQYSIWAHIPVVTAWIGLIMVDLSALRAPGLEAAQRGRLIAWSRPLIVLLIVVIALTGIWQTVYNPVGPKVTNYDTLEQLREKTYGFALFLKHICVAITFALTLAVHFFFAPRLAATPAARGDGAVEAAAPVNTLFLLTAVNLLASLGALIFTARMVWQLH